MARSATASSAIVINDHYEVLETRHGLLLCNRHDVGASRVLRENGQWAYEEIESLREFYGGVMLDIGANIGTHSLFYAGFARVVYAFEPQDQVFNTLCANLLLNNVRNVNCFKCALSNVSGSMAMKGYDATRENCPAGASLGIGDDKVPVRTLDELNIPHIDFIKIDVEGHELKVLKGGQQALQRDHPTVYVETHTRDLANEIIRFMDTLGYEGRLWCHTTIVGPDYPGKVPFTEGWLFTCAH